MKALKQNTGSQRLINDIQLARVRLARAESKWELADAQAREARRRRKEAKQAARRAKKQSRQAKGEFTAAKEVLVKWEERFAAAVERAARNRKLARARLAAKAAAARAGKKVPRKSGVPRPPVPASQKVRSSAAPSSVRLAPRKSSQYAVENRKAAKEQKPTTHRPLSVRAEPASAAAAPVSREEKPIIVPRDVEVSQLETIGIPPVRLPEPTPSPL